MRQHNYNNTIIIMTNVITRRGEKLLISTQSMLTNNLHNSLLCNVAL